MLSLLLSFLFLLSLLVVPSSQQPSPTSSRPACSLNGVADPASGTCVCDRPWSGEACETMLFKPVTYPQGYGFKPNKTTWGGNVLEDVSGKTGFRYGRREQSYISLPPTLLPSPASSSLPPFLASIARVANDSPVLLLLLGRLVASQPPDRRTDGRLRYAFRYVRRHPHFDRPQVPSVCERNDQRLWAGCMVVEQSGRARCLCGANRTFPLQGCRNQHLGTQYSANCPPRKRWVCHCTCPLPNHFVGQTRRYCWISPLCSRRADDA